MQELPHRCRLRGLSLVEHRTSFVHRHRLNRKCFVTAALAALAGPAGPAGPLVAAVADRPVAKAAAGSHSACSVRRISSSREADQQV